MSPNNDKEKEEDKYSIMNVKSKTNDETIINIEIPLKDEHNMRYRTVYYLSKMIAKRPKEGDKYKSIHKTVAINILNFDLLDSGTRFHNRYRFTEIDTKKELTDIAETQFMELPAQRSIYKKPKQSFEKLLETEGDRIVDCRINGPVPRNLTWQEKKRSWINIQHLALLRKEEEKKEEKKGSETKP